MDGKQRGSEMVSVMMLHVRMLDRLADSSSSVRDVVVPPAILSDTRTTTLITAVEDRIRSFWGGVDPQRIILVLNSDKAKSLLKVSRHFGIIAQAASTQSLGPWSVGFVHCNCMMHMLFAALISAMAPCCLASPLYCASLLLRRSANMKSLRKHVRAACSRVRRVFGAPQRDHTASNEALIKLLDAAEHDFLETAGDMDPEESAHSAQARRFQQRRQLLRAFPGRWSDRNDFVHFCDFSVGCGCRSDADAADYAFNMLDSVLLQVRPAVPASNRWNKLFGPLVWWSFAVGFHHIIADAMVAAKADAADISDPVTLAGHIDIGGPDDEQTYNIAKQVRWKKTGDWLSKPETRLHLTTSALVMLPALHFMGQSFRDARLGSSASIIPYASRETSPAEATVRCLQSHLADQNRSFWALVLPEGVWSGTELSAVADMVFSFLAGVCLRCVFPFGDWPWPLV